MDDLIAQIVGISRAMWRRRWIGLAVAWATTVVGAVAVYRMPDRYEATARVYVDTKTVLKPLLQDLTVEPDIDQTVQLLARTLLTRPNVELLMRRAKLDDSTMSATDRNRQIEALSRDIKLTSAGRDNVFSFNYRDVSQTRARVVVENLVALFVESDLGAKARDGESARSFIDQQIKSYEARLAEAEGRLKEFKLRNMELSDSSGKDYFARISALTEELGRLVLDLRAAEQSRDARKRELGGETITLVPDVPPPLTAVSTPELDSRLDAQRKQLDELLRRYTDLHPDVISTKRLIARLEEQKQHEVELRRKAEEGRPAQRAPVDAVSQAVQQQVKLALAEAEATVASLRVRVADTQSRLGQLRASANRVPQVEAELTQLNRDYEVVRRNYEALVARREKASMSEEVDATRLAQFRVIDPPRATEKPVFPNRRAVSPLVLVVALGAGLAACFLMTQLLPTVDSPRALRHLSQRPVLGSVSMLVSGEMQAAVRRHSVAFAAGLGALVVVYAMWVTWSTRA